jgi:hypothetical protein
MRHPSGRRKRSFALSDTFDAEAALVDKAMVV